MAVCLAIDFGNCYTVAAYWHQGFDRVVTLHIPGVTRPVTDSGTGKGGKVFIAPSVISYGPEENQVCLIGQEALEASGFSGGSTRQVFCNLQFDVITGKRVYNLIGDCRLNRQDIAKQYLAIFLQRAGQTLGLGSQAVITFIMPVEACLSEQVWRNYQCWLEDTVRQAGFSRLELVEEPWAVVWGAGMPVTPGAVYIFIKIDEDIITTAIVQIVLSSGDSARYMRIISSGREWIDCQEDTEPVIILEKTIKQTRCGAARVGFIDSCLAGVVVTGSRVNTTMLAVIHNHFPDIPVYDKHSVDAAVCGAAFLASDAGGCGCLRYSYGLRYLAGDCYQYHEIVTKGTFYPSTVPINEFTIKASYDGQHEFGLFIYRLEDGHCINECKPVILNSERPVGRGQAAISVKAGLDSAGQLVVTAVEAVTGRVIIEKWPVVKLA